MHDHPPLPADVGALKWTEQHLYGSSRLGIWNYDTTMPNAPPVVIGTTPVYDSLLLGSRTYELSNHLGNVLSTISDKKIGNDSSGVVNYYIAEVLSQNDYYPFGMIQPARKYSAGDSYRYGFNGKENDNDVSGEGNKLDFGARIYDSRIGKWLSLDQLRAKYPFISPYNYVLNNPIQFVDPTGDEIHVSGYAIELFATLLKKTFADKIKVRIGNNADPNIYGPGLLKISLNVEESKLTENELKAYKEIQRMIESPKKIYIFSEPDNPNIFPDDGGLGNMFATSPDEYKTSEIYPNIIEKTDQPGFNGYNSSGSTIIHFLLEQEYGQINLKQQAGSMGDTFDEAHKNALLKGEPILGFSWDGIAGAVNDNGKFDPFNRQAEVFVIDKDIIKDGKYDGTIRQVFDFRNPEGVKITITKIKRSGLNLGDKYVNPFGDKNLNDEPDGGNKITEQYFRDNPVTIPARSASKKTKRT